MAKILLVEDNEFNRDMLSRRLIKNSFETIVAVNGVESVQLAKSVLPDLILMDMSLPIMDGWEATLQIKADPVTRHIPVIALTAHAMGEAKQKALDAGCDEYDTTPIDFSRLLAKLHKFLE
jgi:CheY-like chemotaxis protein